MKNITPMKNTRKTARNASQGFTSETQTNRRIKNKNLTQSRRMARNNSYTAKSLSFITEA